VSRISIGSLLKRGWMLLVVVVVVAVAGFCDYRLHAIFGSHNTTSTPGGFPNETALYDPKNVVLEVFGHAAASINYLDGNAQPQRVDNTVLPFSYDVTTIDPAVFANIVAQGDSDSSGCRITIDGAVKHERSVRAVSAYTFYLDKPG
jgi:hypothetical protein